MTVFLGIFAVTTKIPMGFAKLVGWELGAAGGHLCSHEGKVRETNMGGGMEKRAARWGDPDP